MTQRSLSGVALAIVSGIYAREHIQHTCGAVCCTQRALFLCQSRVAFTWDARVIERRMEMALSHLWQILWHGRRIAVLFALVLGAMVPCVMSLEATATTIIPLPGTTGLTSGSMNPTGDDPGAIAVDSATNRAFVRDQEGRVYVVDIARHTVLHTLHLHAVSGLTLDAVHQRVFVPSTNILRNGVAIHTDGVVNVLDAATGRVLPPLTAVNHPLQVAIDRRTGRLFVIHDDAANGRGSNVSMLDVTSGRLIRTLPIHHPTKIAVDERTGRAFVLSPSGVTMLDARSGARLRALAAPRLVL